MTREPAGAGKASSTDCPRKSAQPCEKSGFIFFPPPFYSFLVSRAAEWPPRVYLKSELGMCLQDSAFPFWCHEDDDDDEGDKGMLDVTLMTSC